MSCCFSPEDSIGCCGIACPHDPEANHKAQDMRREMAEAKACICLPKSPDDQCPVHGYDVWMLERAREESR